MPSFLRHRIVSCLSTRLYTRAFSGRLPCNIVHSRHVKRYNERSGSRAALKQGAAAAAASGHDARLISRRRVQFGDGRTPLALRCVLGTAASTVNASMPQLPSSNGQAIAWRRRVARQQGTVDNLYVDKTRRRNREKNGERNARVQVILYVAALKYSSRSGDISTSNDYS